MALTAHTRQALKISLGSSGDEVIGLLDLISDALSAGLIKPLKAKADSPATLEAFARVAIPEPVVPTVEPVVVVPPATAEEVAALDAPV